MPLPSECSYDTESGICSDGVTRNVLIQVCSTTASSPDETVLYLGEDCYEQFLQSFEDNMCDVSMYFYNSKWEGKPFIDALMRTGYRYTEGRPGKGEWDVIEDPMKIYRIRVMNQNGYRLTITDDLLQTACSMESAADLVRKERPEWFARVGEYTKLHIDKSLYNTWYQLPEYDEQRALFLEYSRLDAFSQAMISRWLTEKGMHQCLTSASNGLRMALEIRYQRGEGWKDKRAFQWKYPPLCREMQDIVESSLQGGFVWGEVGDHHGVFCHADYKSSYPYEYAFGKLFYGEVTRIKSDEGECFDDAMELPQDRFMIWKVVSFRFDYIPGMMPCLSGIMCENAYEPLKGIGNKKMRHGTVEHKLFTASYLDELSHHYNLTDLQTEEIWVSCPRRGDFKPFIRKCFTEKERPELKGTMERDIWKRAMNAGVHGKTITKTHRERCTYLSGERETVKEVNEPKLCSLIGFTGMMNARERLLRHCRRVLEAGRHVLMCDTDSVVVDCSGKELMEIIGDWFAPKGGTFEQTLGRFELEEDAFGNTDFDEFKCWGLKRYCELNQGRYRKSAFAGMHDESQEGEDEDEQTVLISEKYKGLEELPVNDEVFTWHQLTRRWNGEAYVLIDDLKHACKENVWYEEISYNTLMKRLSNGI